MISEINLSDITLCLIHAVALSMISYVLVKDKTDRALFIIAIVALWHTRNL